jgi:hypothetical protein
MKPKHTEMVRHRLDRIVIFFDDVYRIPDDLQHKYSCAFCGSQAEYVKLDSRNQPIGSYCGDHVFEARRGGSQS